MFDGPIIIEIPAFIKASMADGRRLVEVECSNEEVDAEGDIILQSALMDAAPSFIKTGHLDLEHYSEIGARIGIQNPSSWIVGRPTEVKNIGNGRTSVVGEIMRSLDGRIDPTVNKYDEFWKTLETDPPVRWRASIYGFPKADMVTDCTKEACGDTGATRFLVKGIDWRSLAFTRNPVNTSIKGWARIVSAKAFVEIMKGTTPLMPTTIGLGDGPVGETGPAPPGLMYLPHNLEGAVGQYYKHMPECPHAGGAHSWVAFQKHFMNCCGAPEDHAELLGRALMHWLVTDRRRVHD